MNRIITFIVLLTTVSVFSQSPQAFKYQAIARGSDGDVISSQNVSFRISILKDDINGVIVFTETHGVSTNDFGLVSLEIGNGTQVSGDFTTIDWKSNIHFLKVEMDENGSNNFQVMGVSQILSVPYALHASTSDSDGDWTISGDDIYSSVSGNVGIGTTTPGQQLEVVGDMNIGGENSAYDGNSEFLGIEGRNDKWYLGVQNETSASATDFFIGLSSSEDGIFHIQNNSRVGIGLTNPSEKLEVAGTVKANFFIGDGSLLSNLPGVDGILSSAIGTALEITSDQTVRIYNEIEFIGDNGLGLGDNGQIRKNPNSGRDEFSIYADGDAYLSNSKGSGIHLYGNYDSEHAGNIAFLTGNSGAGDCRMIITGGGGPGNRNLASTHITLGNSLWDWVDDENDTGLLNIKDPQGHPALFIRGASSSEGELAIPSGEAFNIGQWDGSTFQSKIEIDGSGRVGIGTTTPGELLDINGAMHLTPGSAPETPNEGDIYMDSSTHKLRCYDGETWQDLW